MSLLNKQNKTITMTFSWKELVCHGLLKEIGEPSLVKDLLKMVMKERWLFLEEESRDFHSRNVYPIVGVYLSQCGDHASVVYELKRISGYSKVSPILCPEIWLTAIAYKNVKKELTRSWKERIPEQRRRVVMIKKEANLLRWRGHSEYDITSGNARDIDDDYFSIENSIKWYGDIHEGRYYLFWDKNIYNAVAYAASCLGYMKVPLLSSYDINIIDGEGLYKNLSKTWVCNFDQWSKDPMKLNNLFAQHKQKFTMVHSIGKKEKMHIDDMFLKE